MKTTQSRKKTSKAKLLFEESNSSTSGSSEESLKPIRKRKTMPPRKAKKN